MALGLPSRGVRMGAFQRSGPMTVAPLFGPDPHRGGDVPHRGGGDISRARFMPPLTGLKLSRVAGYGNVEIECRSGVADGVAIVPLHIGYIQDKAQNHALCRSALIGSGQKRMFEDACCVQQAQGGYLEERDQWFFVLPIALRDAALRMRGQKDFRKLWAAIAKLNADLGLAARGHLEQIVCHERYYLTQYASRFELCAGQTGALFFLGDKLVGIELAPNAAYFAEAWMPLVCFSYGVMAKALEEAARKRKKAAGSVVRPLIGGETLDALRAGLVERRRAAAVSTIAQLAKVPSLASSEITEDERYLDLRLSTIEGSFFSGQMVEEDDGAGLVYLSLSATPRWLDASN
jgi:hypothetical protein